MSGEHGVGRGAKEAPGADADDRLGRAIEEALASAGATGGDPLVDGVTAPGRAAAAIASFADGEGEALLLLVHPALGGAAEGYTPEPRDPSFLRLGRAPGAHRLVGVRGDGAAEVRPSGVRLARVRVRCCDASTCDLERELVSGWIDLEGRDPVLFAEGRSFVGQPDDGAGDAARAMARALAVELEGEAPSSQIEPGAAIDGLVPARARGRYAARSEGEQLVLRDLFSIGPRASARRNFAVAAVVGVLAALVWIPTGVFAREGATARAVAIGAIAALLTLTAYAFFGVARFSSRYSARSAPLAAFGGGRFVVLPWVGRGGAVDLRPEGRLGAAIPCNEVTAVSVVRRDDHFAVVLESDHGPIDVVGVADERLARDLRGAVARAVDLAKHPDAKPSPRQRARAKAQVSAKAS